MIFASLGDCIELRPLVPRYAAELASCVDNARYHLTSWTMLAARVTDTESARVLLEEYADRPRYFGIWLDRVELHTSTENDRARVIAARPGMRLSAVGPESFVLNGVCHDSEAWALHRQEWH